MNWLTEAWKDRRRRIVSETSFVISFTDKLYGMRGHKKRLVQGFKKLLEEIGKSK